MIQRINVVGTSASGKTTFSRKLAQKMGVAHIEMDALFWKSNWQESSNAEFFAKLEPHLQDKSWVLDGNYSRTTHLNGGRLIW